MTILRPGIALGILGGGQLGRMTAFTARRMGYPVVVFDPLSGGPAGQIADHEIVAGFEDPEAVAQFASLVGAVTLEFENLPAATVERLAQSVPTRPSADVLRICQNRIREREFLQQLNIAVAPFVVVATKEELHGALRQISLPALLKTAALGYDSKGQQRVNQSDDAEPAFAALGQVHCILEELVPFEREISVVVARDTYRHCATYDVAENLHRHGILDISVVPASIPTAVANEARALAVQIAEGMDLVGVLAVEMFLLSSGQLVVNELAPRPHNSAHWSIEACITSQFEQQARIALGMPLGPTTLLAPAATANLLGDLWNDGEPYWEGLLALSDVKLHLYGKEGARPGRKMGHVTALGSTADAARSRVLEARAALTGTPRAG